MYVKNVMALFVEMDPNLVLRYQIIHALLDCDLRCFNAVRIFVILDHSVIE